MGRTIFVRRAVQKIRNKTPPPTRPTNIMTTVDPAASPSLKQSSLASALVDGRLFAKQRPVLLDAQTIKARLGAGDVTWWSSVATSVITAVATTDQGLGMAVRARNHGRVSSKEAEAWRAAVIDEFIHHHRTEPRTPRRAHIELPPPTENECRSPGHFARLYGPKRSNIALSPRWAQKRLEPLVSPRASAQPSIAEQNAMARAKAWRLDPLVLTNTAHQDHAQDVDPARTRDDATAATRA